MLSLPIFTHVSFKNIGLLNFYLKEVSIVKDQCLYDYKENLNGIFIIIEGEFEEIMTYITVELI